MAHMDLPEIDLSAFKILGLISRPILAILDWIIGD